MIDHKVNGFLACPRDSEELAKGIEWVLADSEKRRDMGRAAREKILQDFNIAGAAAKYMDLFSELIFYRRSAG